MLSFLFVLVLLATLVVVHYDGFRRGYSRGKADGLKDGYQQGFADAKKFSELWWVTAEKEVDQARQAIWKEEERWP